MTQVPEPRCLRFPRRLRTAAAELEAKGITALAVSADLSDSEATRAAVAKERDGLGPISVLQWTAYGNGAKDLLSASSEEVTEVLSVPVQGLLAAVQASLPDLRQAERPAILVTNGGLGFDAANAMAVDWGVMGLALANAAKHKLVGLLAEKLKGENIYVGEVFVMGVVKGTAFDQGNGTIEASAVAEAFAELYEQRNAPSVQVR